MITYKSACELADQFPPEIGTFLDLEAGLHGGHFGEESVTDLFMAALLKLPGNRAIVQKPDEPKTGGDMDWFIYDQNRICGYRIQSKRLSCETKKWTTYSFKELAHPRNTGKQGKNLVKKSNLKGKATGSNLPIVMYPLYCFYSPNIAVKKSSNAFKAIMLADGYLIERIIDRIANKSTKTTTDRRISNLYPYFFDLSQVFCPGMPGTAVAPSRDVGGLASPAESTRNVSAALRNDSKDVRRPQSAPFPETFPRSERINKIIATIEERSVRGERIQEVKSLDRPRAFLLAE